MIKELVSLKQIPLVMGIINCTPDSFYRQSRKAGIEEALREAERMAEGGADILDIGGESTRPGSLFVSEEEELERVIPVIEAVKARLDIPVSVDTRKSGVAEAALRAGASIINDISALSDDPSLASVAVRAGCDIILMHRRGIPENMQDNPFYLNAASEIREELGVAADRAMAAGIARDRITVDPGIGFGKRVEDNIEIIKRIEYFREMGFPVLIGHSRKSFLGSITGRGEPGERLAGSLAASIVAAINRADILRVHDVAETVDALKVLMALRPEREIPAAKENQ